MTLETIFPLTLPAVKGTPNADEDRLHIYTVEAPASAVAEFYVEPAMSVLEGFQRPLDEGRANAIGKLMTAQAPNIHGGLLAFAKEDEVTFERNKLTIRKPLRLIDGQHRAAGAHWAIEHSEEEPQYTETVRIVVGAERAELAMWYLRANVEARKVSPANIITNVAAMSGQVLRRKSWVSRMVVALAGEEPFMIDNISLVNFGTHGALGKISANTLYRAVDLVLPAALNSEGEKEVEAIRYAHRAFTLYAELARVWGVRNPDGTYVNLDSYSFTMLVAFARLYRAADDGGVDFEDVVRKAWTESKLSEGMPSGVGSGERAAVAIASFAAGHGDINLDRVA